MDIDEAGHGGTNTTMPPVHTPSGSAHVRTALLSGVCKSACLCHVRKRRSGNR